MGASTKLDQFLVNPQVRTCSLAVLGTSRNNDYEKRGPIGDRSLGDPCPKAVFSTYYSCIVNDSEPEEMHHVVRGVQEEIRYCPHMVTGIQEGIPYCSTGISPGKQKKVRSTSQPQFRSENTSATIEADQI